MKRVVEFPLEEGGSVFVEMESDPQDHLVPAALPGDIAAKASRTFESTLETIRPAASAIIKNIRALVDAPDEIAVEFGIKVSAKAGAILASADAEANYKISLTWRRGGATAQVATGS